MTPTEAGDDGQGPVSTSDEIDRIGLLTNGGDCPGLNAVIRAVTKTAILDYGVEVIGIKDGYCGLGNLDTVALDYASVSGILTRGGTILGTSNVSNPFSWPVKEGGETRYEDISDTVLNNYHALGLDALVCIGGDGTMNIAKQLMEKGLKIVGVPKTIDNDLNGTDRTFGFDSAVATAVDAIDKIHTTAMSHHRVMIIECMGRYAGWLTLTAGVAGGGDVLLIPEIPFSYDAICDIVNARSTKGRRFSIIVVAEGARPAGGEIVVKRTVDDGTDPIRLGGIGRVIANEIEARTGLETRVTTLGHIQRGGSPSAYDRTLATLFGHHAMELVIEGAFGKMVNLKNGSIGEVDLIVAGSGQRLVPRDDPLIKAALSVGTSFGVQTL